MLKLAECLFFVGHHHSLAPDVLYFMEFMQFSVLLASQKSTNLNFAIYAVHENEGTGVLFLLAFMSFFMITSGFFLKLMLLVCYCKHLGQSVCNCHHKGSLYFHILTATGL